MQDICKVSVGYGVIAAEKKEKHMNNAPNCWIEHYALGDPKHKTTVRRRLSRPVQHSQSENKQAEAVIQFGIVPRKKKKKPPIHTGPEQPPDLHRERSQAVSSFVMRSPIPWNKSCRLTTRHWRATRCGCKRHAHVALEKVSWIPLAPLPGFHGWSNTSTQWKMTTRTTSLSALGVKEYPGSVKISTNPL